MSIHDWHIIAIDQRVRLTQEGLTKILADSREAEILRVLCFAPRPNNTAALFKTRELAEANLPTVQIIEPKARIVKFSDW